MHVRYPQYPEPGEYRHAFVEQHQRAHSSAKREPYERGANHQLAYTWHADAPSARAKHSEPRDDQSEPRFWSAFMLSPDDGAALDARPNRYDKGPNRNYL